MATFQEQSAATTQPQTQSGSCIKMCPELKAFYDRHGIVGAEEMLVADAQHEMRFVRLNPRHDKDETLAHLKVRTFPYIYFVFVLFQLWNLTRFLINNRRNLVMEAVSYQSLGSMIVLAFMPFLASFP